MPLLSSTLFMFSIQFNSIQFYFALKIMVWYNLHSKNIIARLSEKVKTCRPDRPYKHNNMKRFNTIILSRRRKREEKTPQKNLTLLQTKKQKQNYTKQEKKTTKQRVIFYVNYD